MERASAFAASRGGRRGANPAVDAGRVFGARRGGALALGLALGFAALPAAASVWKCKGDNGAPFYQDTPCPPGRELRDFDKDPPTVSVLPLGPAPGTSTKSAAPAAPPRAAARAKTTRAAHTAPSAREIAERRFIAPGVDQGEVMARLGAPDLKHGGSTSKTMRWTYLPQPEDPGTITTLTFERGRLVEVERKVVR